MFINVNTTHRFRSEENKTSQIISTKFTALNFSITNCRQTRICCFRRSLNQLNLFVISFCRSYVYIKGYRMHVDILTSRGCGNEGFVTRWVQSFLKHILDSIVLRITKFDFSSKGIALSFGMLFPFYSHALNFVRLENFVAEK